MSRYRVCVLLGAALASLLADGSAHGQVYLGRRLGGIVVQAPFVPRVSIGVGVAPVRPYLLPRRRVLGGLYGVPPYLPPVAGALPAGPPAVVQRPGPATSNYSPAPTAASNLPSDAALRAMDDTALLNAAVSVTRQLDDDLVRFDTGLQWRSYLQLPADALPPPSNNQVTLGLASLERTLVRFDKIAANSGYGMISELASFDASRSALAEVVRRFGARRPGSVPAAVEGSAEELPAPSAPPATVATSASAPTLTAPSNTPAAEQSILIK